MPIKKWPYNYYPEAIMKTRLVMSLTAIILMVSAMSFAQECGDVNNDGKMNLLDVSYIITDLYRSGPDPDCGAFAGFPCWDVNADGNKNLLDISYIISHLYRSGPEPFCGAFFDIDGNMYKAVKIGDQWWMAENLKVTHYRNGDAIANVTDNTEWIGLFTGAYCEYDNDADNVAVYGRLYNWFVISDSRNVAPEGWHVPTDAEWKQLEMSIGMSPADADLYGYRGIDEGGKLKEIGTTHWFDPNTGATDESGFGALPGGFRDRTFGEYYSINYIAPFWSSTENDSFSAPYRFLENYSSQVGRLVNHKRSGYSIRCVKD
jgi:uncharacterized protein (TIGR02145 family)